MKLSIKAELVYNFAEATQIIANLEASQTGDQIIRRKRLRSSRRRTFYPIRRHMETAEYARRSQAM
jgi:hypothetical protein